MESHSCLCPDNMEKVLGFECRCKSGNPDCYRIFKINLVCKSDQFMCKTGKCIDGHHKCDNHIDCPDGSDEIDCNSSKNKSQKACSKYQEFLCDDKSACIDSVDKCDGEYDCEDFSDEKYCPRCKFQN